MKNPFRQRDSFPQSARVPARSGDEIPRRDPHAVCPASFEQEWAWQREQAEPGRATYNLPAAFRVIGALDRDCLEQSLHSLEERHEVLRSVLSFVNGRLIQIIQPAEARPLASTDLSSLPEAEREPEALRLAALEARRPFDLVNGPLWRVALVRFAPDDHLFMFTVHEMILDHASLSELFAELSQLYPFFLGQPAANSGSVRWGCDAPESAVPRSGIESHAAAAEPTAR